MPRPSALSTGQLVKVFADPNTEAVFEGVARLVRFHQAEEDGTEFWDVQFVSSPLDGYLFRQIHVNNVVEDEEE